RVAVRDRSWQVDIVAAVERVQQAERVLVRIDEISSEPEQDIADAVDRHAVRTSSATKEFLEKSLRKDAGEHCRYLGLSPDDRARAVLPEQAREALVIEGVHAACFTGVQEHDGIANKAFAIQGALQGPALQRIVVVGQGDLTIVKLSGVALGSRMATEI